MTIAATTRVSIEETKTWAFAVALDWPGWCRRGRGAGAALEALLDYRDRYAVVAGPGFSPGPIEVVGRVEGNRTTDFGAPGARGPWDDEALDQDEADRMVSVLEASWRYLDGVVAGAPAELSKGPRGGGRDRDPIADHVREAERAYSAKIGGRILPRTPWLQQRATIAAALSSRVSPGPWQARYAVRRIAWHVLDHAWEIEDKATMS